MQVAAGDVLAHRLGRRLVVADGAHHAAPGRIERAHAQRQKDQQHDGKEPGIGDLHEVARALDDELPQRILARRRGDRSKAGRLHDGCARGVAGSPESGGTVRLSIQPRVGRFQAFRIYNAGAVKSVAWMLTVRHEVWRKYTALFTTHRTQALK